MAVFCCFFVMVVLQCLLRERENTQRFCKMHKLFDKKRTFPNNWSNLSQEKALEYINYLIKNYKNYNITFHGDKIQIDNIFIEKKEMQILRYTFLVYVINNRMFTLYSEVGRQISTLIYYCRHPEKEKTLWEKLEEFLKKHKLDMTFVLIALVAAMVCVAIVRINDKNKKQKQKQQEQFEKIVNTKNNQIKTLNIVNIMNQKLRSL